MARGRITDMTPERWQLAERLYHEAEALDPSERSAFLAKHCAADDDLRHEVESLLAQADAAKSFMAGSAIRVAAAAIGVEGMSGRLVGTCLGPYDIKALLGAGGMGEVYRARDAKLGRDVALKILPDVFTADSDRRARFEREARLLASVNHPHIAAIYGFEELVGIHALVLELVEGETLAARLTHASARGLEPSEALAIARQIAEALEAAHERGIVHRDLKPANIAIRRDGAVKVLDFGIAKIAADPADCDATKTREGLLLGTAAYMSPEQARGKTVDKRTDVWAFGCVLFEMLTGRTAFARDTVSDTMAAILEREPDWTNVPAGTPQTVVRLLRRCLEKDPNRRLHDIADARIEIDDAIASSRDTERFGVHARSPREWRQRRMAWSAGAVCLLAAAGFGWLTYGRRSADSAITIRSTIPLPDGTSIGAPTVLGQGPSIALSPNGRSLVFAVTGSDNRSRLWLRPLDGNAAEPLAGTEDGALPFWSPDSRSISFFSTGDRKLKRVDVTGRVVLTVCEDPQGFGGGGSWNGDGVILFAPTLAVEGGPINRVAASGGTPKPVTTVDVAAGELRHFAPAFLEDGRHFLYTSMSSSGSLSVFTGSLEGPEKTLLIRDAANVQNVPGRLLFIRGTTLFMQPFDAGRRSLAGEATPIVEGVAIEPRSRTGVFSASSNGVLAYQAGAASAASQLTWFDRTGKATGVLGEPADYNTVNLSPDGTRAAVTLRDANRNMDVWVVDAVRGMRTRFTFDPAEESIGVWSPDGASIAFDSARTGRRDLYRKTANGSGSEDLIDANPINKVPTSWSPDGKSLLYNSAAGTPRTGNDLWIVPLAGQQKPYVFLQTPFNETRAQFAPDGRWIAYSSNESGRNEVYVAPYPATGSKWQVSSNGGGSPRWRRDGRELFYVALDGSLTAVALNSRESLFEVDAVETLFKPRMRDQFNGIPYDVRADGKAFLVNTLLDRTPPSSITIVVNWPALVVK